MLDHQTARRIRKGAHAACALIAASLALAPAADAQVGSLVPASPPSAPGAESPTAGGDTARRSAWAGAGLRAPLELAWRTEADPAHAPVAVAGRVFVQTRTALRAVQASDGAQLWSVPLGATPAELAADSRRVYLTTSGGVAALDAATGALQWVAGDAGATGPAVAFGRVFTGNAAGEVVARDAASGSEAWRTKVGIPGARPAIAGSRIYATNVCRGVSLDVLLGSMAWTTGCGGDLAGVRTVLTGGLVFAEGGALYENGDGDQLFPAGGPSAVGAGVLFVNPLSASALQARDAGNFGVRWTWTPPLPGALAARPAIVDDTVFQLVATNGDGLVLGGIDAATGAERWSGFLPGSGAAPSGAATGVAVSPGLLLVPGAGDELVALRNAPQGPLGVRATLPRNVVEIGERTTVSGRLTSNGHGLVGPRVVFLQADPHPFNGRYRTLGAAMAGRNGFAFEAPVPRNTRFRLAADGVRYAPTAVYVRPAIRVEYAKTKAERVVKATLRIGAAKGFRRSGRVALYRLKAGDDAATRIGTGRAKANGVARFRVRIPADLTESDAVLPCLRGGSKRGFGAPNVLDRFCGDREIAVPAQASAAGLSLSTGTGSAIPLKRFMPASVKR